MLVEDNPTFVSRLSTSCCVLTSLLSMQTEGRSPPSMAASGRSCLHLVSVEHKLHPLVTSTPSTLPVGALHPFSESLGRTRQVLVELLPVGATKVLDISSYYLLRNR